MEQVDKSDLASENINSSDLDIGMNEIIRESCALLNIKEKEDNLPDYRFLAIELNDNREDYK
jgi:hypothetical protein